MLSLLRVNIDHSAINYGSFIFYKFIRLKKSRVTPNSDVKSLCPKEQRPCVKLIPYIKPKTESLMKIFFFTEKSLLCRAHLYSYESCMELDCPMTKIKQLMKYLNSAKDSIYVCMYCFTSEIFASAIIAAQKRGVVVKVIYDSNMDELHTSQVSTFRRACIKVRTKNSHNLMHHKFAIIDNNILITGSANWTMQALFGNAENIIVTDHPVLVERFLDEFANLWKVYDK